LEHASLNSDDLEVASGYLRWLVNPGHRFAEALDLARRLDACTFDPSVPARPVCEARRCLVDLSRHLGYYTEAEKLARAEAERSRDQVAGSYDEQAQADVLCAAALYDPHRFSEIEELLAPWLQRLDRDPWLVLPETRVMVLNTVARARVVLGKPGWEDLFQQSLDILHRRDPVDMARTRNYRAHGLLRHRRTEEAGVVLCENDTATARNEMSRWMLRFYQAEYVRQRGVTSTDQEMEGARSDNRGRIGHPFGCYFQATARQLGRSLTDATERFGVARQLFLRDAGDGTRRNILTFLADCMLLGESAWRSDVNLWEEARAALARHLHPHEGRHLAEYYRETWESLGPGPNREAADAFLCRVPFF
jgi:hypothetical protein